MVKSFKRKYKEHEISYLEKPRIKCTETNSILCSAKSPRSTLTATSHGLKPGPWVKPLMRTNRRMTKRMLKTSPKPALLLLETLVSSKFDYIQSLGKKSTLTLIKTITKNASKLTALCVVKSLQGCARGPSDRSWSKGLVEASYDTLNDDN